MSDEEIDDLVFEIEEIFCTPGYIFEPAGSRCGYGISEEGEKALIDLLKSKLQNKT